MASVTLSDLVTIIQVTSTDALRLTPCLSIDYYLVLTNCIFLFNDLQWTKSFPPDSASSKKSEDKVRSWGEEVNKSIFTPDKFDCCRQMGQ